MTLISYNLGIPNAPNNPSNDQPNMKDNNDHIAQFVAVDHVPFNVNLSGIHQQVTFPPSLTTPATTANQIALFSKFVAGDGNCLFLTRANSTVFDVQLTTDKIVTPVAANSGYTFLPGGILIQWGQILAPGTSGSIVFSAVGNVAFPNAIFNLQLSLQRGSAGQVVTIDNASPPTKTGFSYLTSSGGSNVIYWLAIGN